MLRSFLLIVMLLTLGPAALPLAVAPTPRPPTPTPACPQVQYADPAALLAALPNADYSCAEELALALRPFAEPPLVAALITMAGSGPHDLARRNALRTLGRFAEAPNASRAHESVVRSGGAALQDLARTTLAHERDNFLLQDAVWLLDQFFYPSLGAASGLEQVATDTALAAAVRYRAAAARGRLIFARAGPLASSDRAFILNGLASDDPGVRTAAARAIRFLRPEQRHPTDDHAFATALAQAWANEPPLSLAPDPPDPRATTLFGFAESSPTSLTARASIARAQDHLTGNGTRLADLRLAYEQIALPYSQPSNGLTVRSGLPPERLPALVSEITRTWAMLDQIVGPSLAQPIPGEATQALTVKIFARQGIYRDYMRAFTPFTVDVDGIYDQAAAILYTHERQPEQSANTLNETLRHEATHHYTAVHLFPGSWLTPGYHREPKGWADEGLAELMAGLGPSQLGPRPAQLARICERAVLPPLASLLAQRAGYDQFGRFDYDAAWAFTAYLWNEQPAALRQIYSAYREESYQLSAWERLAGLSLGQAETEWNAAVGRWCGGSSPAGPPGSAGSGGSSNYRGSG
ncbi:MAG: collagenase [Oscillochloridaceae bacterium umkhey_bin13]